MFSQQICRNGRRIGQMAWGQTQRSSLNASQRRCYAETAQGSRSGVGRGLGLVLYGLTFGGIGAAATWYNMMGKRLNGISDAETLRQFVPTDDETRRIEETINNLPMVKELRSRPGFKELRPHLKMAPEIQRQSLTAGSLRGHGKLVVPPYVWIEEGGKSLVCVGYVGDAVCGYPGKVHGGFLATMLDEGLARCCFGAVPHNVAVTARLEIDYRKPAQAGNFFVMRAKTTKVEGRKAWVEGHIETLPATGGTPVVLAEAKALFVSPKWAALLPKVLE
ncbi:UPF0644 protein PB2B4.06 [Cladobotryum mycophilum]|uniref:UPF0644 protein PB2B4.06 n=1 Tax=Cladobotryum mycophilum TaxID=491253 RepID=A0ABR0S699_9HYPO